MGIPKFYRWLSERYPLLNMPVTATEAPPEIDNLYLDMNGIIHNCTHANDPSLKLTETEMVMRIFAYLDKLIHIIKPQRLVFLAIDGVAPRAKMNQQRSRRFKSALERLAREAEEAAKGCETPEEYKFDSNCITPGTAFMARLGRHLRFFIRKKMAEDPVWQAPLVVFSGHDVPGEGEHKIMEWIRWQRGHNPGYAPNQRHCMYGLDADLIMLSLVTHEPHFCLLREVVSFTGKNRGQPSRDTLDNPCAENFILFQIGLLREYLELEFSASLDAARLGFPLDGERLIDDVVLFCMLVGNDFLPALPTLDIAEGALNSLIDTYKALLPRLGGYLTHAGELNHERLQILLGAIADAELATLEERAADTEWFEAKRAKRGGRGGGGGGGGGGRSTGVPRASGRGGRGGGGGGSSSSAGSRGLPVGTFSGGAFAALDDDPALPWGSSSGGGANVAVPVAPVLEELGALEAEDEPETGPTMMSREARQLFLAGGGEEALAAWKLRYYREKLEVPDASPASTSIVVGHYIRGLHWVLQYYYRGVASWDWFYPYHYAPMASDMRVLRGIDVSFSRGRPFRPFEQLLAVLPSASCSLLPPAFQWLMTDERSPIVDFYPEKFDIDMEGKRAEWEGVVKVPFVDEARLLAAAASIPLDRLTAEERRRNDPGDMLAFEHAVGRHEPEHCDSTLPRHFASIAHAHSMCRHVPPPDALPPDQPGFVPALLRGTLTGKRNPPGFPTLKTMSNLKAELKAAGVNVFGNPSKKQSLILLLPDVSAAIGADAAGPLLRGMLAGRVYVKWPYLQEAEIVAVSDARQRMSAAGVAPHAPPDAAAWQTLAGQTKNAFLTKTGIDIGPTPLLLDVRVCAGFVRGADGSVSKHYARGLATYPLQAVLQSRPRPPPGFADPDAPKALALAPGARAVWVGAHYFGCIATVLADPAAKLGGTSSAAGYHVRLQPLHQELLLAESRARQTVQQLGLEYVVSGAACRMLRVHPRLLGRITGNVWVNDSQGERHDIGLAVKNAKQGLCVPAFCKPAAEGSGWLYSAALLDLVRQYKARYPAVFAALDPSAGGGGGFGGGDGDGGGGERRNVSLAELFPHSAPEQYDSLLQEVRTWLKSQASSKRPLVAMATQQASDAAVDRLQLLLPGLLPVGATAAAPVELEHVHPSLLLPPHDPAAPTSVLAGGVFEPGDRVVVLAGRGSPPFGARATVTGVMPTGVELLMDDEFPGGTTLNGRLRGPRGAYVPPEQLLNVSRQQPVRYVGAKPRIAAARQQRGSTRAQQAAVPGEAGPKSPTALAAAAPVAMPLLELAPWLKGKQLQHLQARQAAAAAAAAEDAAAAAAAEAAAAAAQPAGGQGPGPGAGAGPSAAADAQPRAPPTFSQGSRLLQMLHKQGRVQRSVQEPPTKLPPQQQQAQPLPQPQLPQGSSGAGPAPPPLPGQALLRQLQQGNAHGRRTSHEQQRQSPPPAQLHAGHSAPQPVSPQGVPVVAAMQQLSLAPAPGPPAPSAGASLLAMLQKQQAKAQPPQQQPQQQQQRQDDVAAAQAQAKGKVVPRPRKQAQQQQQQQQPQTQAQTQPPQPQQQQPSQEAGSAANAAAAAAAVAAASAGLSSHANKKAAARSPARQQAPPPLPPQQTQPLLPQQPAVQHQPARAPSPAAVSPAPAPAAVRTSVVSPPAAAAGGRTRSKSDGQAANGAAPGTREAPRTPPAGAGSSLLARGEKVARLPVPGSRGFTLGRGQRASAPSGSLPGPAAPGSSGGGAAAAALPAGCAPAAPGSALAVQLAAGALPAAAAVAGAAAAHDRPAGGQAAAPAPLQSCSSESGLALMRLLQQGASRGAAVPPVQQPWQPAAQQPLLSPTGAPAAPAPAPGAPSPAAVAVADAVAAANVSAASNLLRRLQSQKLTPGGGSGGP